MMALRQPCPGCPTLSWIQEKPVVCSDCGCTLARYELLNALVHELELATRGLTERARDVQLIALVLRSPSGVTEPLLTKQELRAVHRFRDALSALWVFDHG